MPFLAFLVVSAAWLACAREANDSRESMDDLDGSFYSELWIEGW